MEVVAKGKNIRMSPRKVRLVVAMISGKRVQEAADVLKLSKKRAAGAVLKVLNSATANAGNNFNLGGENLVISRAMVDKGPTLKRGRFVSRGRRHQILKRTAHVTIGLREVSSKGGAASGGKSQKSPKQPSARAQADGNKLATGQAKVKSTLKGIEVKPRKEAKAGRSKKDKKREEEK